MTTLRHARMAPDCRPAPDGRRAAVSLIECITYLALLGLLLGLAFVAFYRAHENTRNLHRDTAELTRALHAGERWREDVRKAAGPPRLERDGADALLRLPLATGDVSYVFRERAIWRRSWPNTNWLPLLPGAIQSVVRPDPRRHVTAWRWDVELESRPGLRHAPAVFTFIAAQPERSSP